jgi:general L-amino acid transport system permease protein|tara:strand:- start:2283 stop:3746 length:1464 start_codon:yes stop_codon:yes gene_type:complete
MSNMSYSEYFSEVKSNPRKLFDDSNFFLLNNWTLIIGIYFYYIVTNNFFRQSLLLFQDGQYGVPFYYDYLEALTNPVIDILSFWLPIIFSILVFSGIYYLNIGSFNPKQTDRNGQLVFFVALIPFLLYFILQLLYLNQTDKSWYFGLEYMDEDSGFQLSNDWPWETDLYDSRWKFYAVGISNAIRVVILSIFLSTVIGTFFGVARLSTNLVLSKIAEAYVEFFRNMPLVVQLFFWLTMLGDILPRHNEMWIFWDWFYVSNRTIMFPRIVLDSIIFLLLAICCLIGFRAYTNYLDKDGVDDSDEGLRQRMYLWIGTLVALFIFLKIAFTLEQPELVKPNSGYASWYFTEGEEISVPFVAMMIGLTIYTSVQIAEIVRGSIQSLPRGQVEAAISLGLSPFQRLRLVILPQALRSMIPPMNNQYLNCWKNSSLAIIISFSDHFAVTLTIVNNAGQAVPAFIMLLITYQVGSLLISAIMNYLNSRVTSVKI